MTNLFESELKDVTRLILIRHGRTSNNKEDRVGTLEDIPLDHRGVEQAQKVAERLKEFPIGVIYSSPILRSKQTADIIADTFHMDVEIDKNLMEYNFGIISKHTMSEIRDKYPELYQDLDQWMNMGPTHERKRPIIPNSEPFKDFDKRLFEFKEKILDNHPGQVVAAITHLAVIKGYMATLFGGSVFRQMNYLAFNTSLTVIDFYNRVPILLLFNDTRHLDLPLKYGKVTPL